MPLRAASSSNPNSSTGAGSVATASFSIAPVCHTVTVFTVINILTVGTVRVKVGGMQTTARKAHQLVAASARSTLDPFVDVDWSVPIDDSSYHLPLDKLPLFGTPQWDAMSEAERRTYSRH